MKSYIAYRCKATGTKTLILGTFSKKKFALLAVIVDEEKIGVSAHVENHGKFSTINTGKYLYVVRPLTQKENTVFLKKCKQLKKIFKRAQSQRG